MEIAVTLIFASLLSVQANSPVGMIVQADGEVFIRRGAQQERARLADLLFAGDRVVTTTGQATLLFCPSSERATVQNGSTVELTASSLAQRGGPPMAKAAAKCALPKVALGAENLERVGAMRPRGNPPVAIFTGGPVTTGRPVFEWAAAPAAASFQVTVNNVAGRRLWQTRTTSTSIAYPETMAPLAEGEYQWEVRGDMADGKIAVQQSAPFRVKPNADLSKPVANDPAARFARAVELEDAGYFAEASAYYRAALQANPTDARLARRLVGLYWDAGLIAAVDELVRKYNIKVGPQ